MSFSNDVKNEISRILIDNQSLVICELAGLVRMCGTIIFNGQDLQVQFVTENASIARRIFTFLKTYSKNVDAHVSKNMQLKKKNNYILTLAEGSAVRELLYDTGFIEGENVFSRNYVMDDRLLRDGETRRAYIRGSFLGAGSISNPDKAYHAEFVTNNLDHAENLSEIINSFALNSKIVKRKDNYVVYLKEAEQISDLLAIIGANKAIFKFENIRVVKDVRNNINRIVNCETANINKTINAALKQIEDINLIDEMLGLDNIDDNLREVAILRKEHSVASLQELGDMLSPKVSKSGVNHRLKKIGVIAKELRGEEDERSDSEAN